MNFVYSDVPLKEKLYRYVCLILPLLGICLALLWAWHKHQQAPSPNPVREAYLKRLSQAPSPNPVREAYFKRQSCNRVSQQCYQRCMAKPKQPQEQTDASPPAR